MKKISNKIILAISLSVLLSSIAIGGISLTRTITEMNTVTEDYLVNLVSYYGERLEKDLKEIEHVTTIKSNVFSEYMDTFDDFDTNEEAQEGYAELTLAFAVKNADIDHLISEYTAFSSDFIFDNAYSNRRVDGGGAFNKARFRVETGGYNETDGDWFYISYARNEDYWCTPYYWDYEDGKGEQLVVSFSTPIKYKGTTVGTTAIDYSLEGFRSLLSDVSIYEHGYVYLMTPTGDIVYHPESEIKNIHTYDEGSMSFLSDLFIDTEDNQGFEEYEYKGEKKIGAYTKLSNGWILVAAPVIDEMNAGLRDLGTIIVFATLFFAALSIVVAFFMGKSIAKPITKINEASKKIASGDLTVKLDVKSKDEVGQLADSFREFIANTSHLVNNIKHKTKEVDDYVNLLTLGAETVLENSNLSNERAKEVSSQVGDVTLSVGDTSEVYVQNSNEVNVMASAIEEISATINEMITSTSNISGNAVEVAGVVSSISDDFTEIKKANHAVNDTIDEVNKSMLEFKESLQAINESCQTSIKISNEAEEKSTYTMNSIEETSKAVNNVSKVVSIINSIAEQTNLLALNATIEAASAGEAGKGFAIVASEVKSLASETRKATEQIEAQIQAMQSHMEISVEGVGDTTKIIKELSKSSLDIAADVSKQAQTTEQLASEISETSVLFGQSTTKLEEGTSELVTANNQIQDIAAGINAIASSGNQINDATQESTVNITHFAATIQEVSATSNEISDTLKDVSANVENVVEMMEGSTVSVKENIYTSAKSLEQVSNELKIEVDKFKVNVENEDVVSEVDMKEE